MNFFIRSRREESGASVIEYAVLLAFLTVMLIGTVSILGENSAAKLCFASMNHNSGDLNRDGMVNYHDLTLMGGAHGTEDINYDLDCDGVVEHRQQTGSTPTQGDDNLIWHSNWSDWIDYSAD